MAVTGGVTSAGASLADYGITKDHCKQAQDVYNTDMEATNLLFTYLDNIKKLHTTLSMQMEKMQKWSPEDVSRTVDHFSHDMKGLGMKAVGAAAMAAWKSGAFECVKELQSVGGSWRISVRLETMQDWGILHDC